jgi:hypothetical protein
LSFASLWIQVVGPTVTACDTAATDMTGLFRSVTAFDLNWGSNAALAQSTLGDDVCISLSASVNGGGVITYASLNY